MPPFNHYPTIQTNKGPYPLSNVTNLFRKPRSPRTDRLLLTLPFYLLFLAQLAHHILWRDEMNAWAISDISRNLPDLLHRVHYEAHPALWYLILFTASHISHSLWMFKLVEAIIGTGIYFLLAWASPFRRLELLLILLSYYLLFEYTVMCRMYGLELLFALAYASFRSRRPDWVFRNTLWLALIANVDVTGAILAGALLLEYGLARLTRRQSSSTRKAREVAGGLAIFSASFAFAIATLWPAKDIGWVTTGKMFAHFSESDHLVQGALKWISLPWLPKSINIMDQWAFSEMWPYFYAAPVILFLLYLIFRDHWRWGAMLAALTLTGILFSQITGVAGTRHTGIVYIAFLVALWVLRFQGARVSLVSYALLFLPIIPGIIGVIDQWSWPFADSEAASQWIVQQHLENLPLFGSPDTNVLGVPERLHRPIYQLECNCVDTVLTFSIRRDSFNPDTDIPPRLIQGFRTLHVSDGIFLINRPLTRTQTNQLTAGGLHAQRIGEFDRGLLGDEYIDIYRITALPPSTR